MEQATGIMMAPRLRAPRGARRGSSVLRNIIHWSAAGAPRRGRRAFITTGGMGVSTPIILSQKIRFS